MKLSEDIKNSYGFIIYVILALYISTIVIQETNYYLRESYNKGYDEARNQTIKEITSNSTVIEKMEIISFNCEKINLGTGWVNQCKNDLSKELI